MKKIYFLGIIVLLLFQVIIDNKIVVDNKQIDVFAENKPIIKNHYYISFRKENCTSINLEDYFKEFNIELETIYPENKLIIEDERINQQLSSFTYVDQNTLQNKYIMILEKYGLYDDIEKVKQYGIIISKVEIKTSYQELKKLLQRFPNLQYSYQKQGKYQ